MCNSCITYKELAVHLKLAEKTVKQNWRYYPHYFVTPASKRSNNLKGARFNLDDVMNSFKEMTRSTYNDNREIYERGQTSNAPQMPRGAVPHEVQYKTGGKITENRLKKNYKEPLGYASEYSVF